MATEPSVMLAAAERVRTRVHATAAAPGAPLTELGSQTRLRTPSGFGVLNPGLLHEQEYTTAWRWPVTVQTVDRMRNDAQIEALYTAIALSVRRRRWLIEPNQARPEITEAVATDLGLPVRGEAPRPEPRGEHRFSWDRHVQHVLLGLLYGAYYFEQVGHIDDQGLWRLDKLAPRPPRTVQYVSVDADGGLESITQFIGRNDTVGPAAIPVNRLAAYVWDQEGANWYGRSMLRAVYREFDIKDRLIKVDAVKHARNGMGVPIPHATQPGGAPGAETDALRMATALRAGEDAGGTMPYGWEMRILGVQGQLPDTLASIKQCDEAIARRFLAMFTMLGQTSHGSRALGESFVDFFALALDTIADWVCDVTTRHVIEDWVEWNYGPTELHAPRLVSERDDTPELAVQDLIAAVQAGAVTVDDELQNWFRDRYGLPELAAGGPAVPAGAPTPLRLAAARRASAAAGAVTLPDRPLRRDPNPQEASAAVDFAEIEAAYVGAVDALVARLDTLRADQITELVDQVAAAGDDLAAIARVTATPAGAEEIAAAMREIATAGAHAALHEAEHQGLTPPDVSMDALAADLEARAAAIAETLATDVANTAARAALRLHGATGLQGTLAEQVGTYLSALKWQLAQDEVRGALQSAQNVGRFAQVGEAERAAGITRIYHSALLDVNTCGPCAEQDGKEYTDLQDVQASFATLGGYALCEGRERCRCTAVAVYDEATPSVP